MPLYERGQGRAPRTLFIDVLSTLRMLDLVDVALAWLALLASLLPGALRAPPNDPRVSPLLAPNHVRLPRAVVQVFGLDPLRDEGLLYARVLRDAGVEVYTNMYVLFSSRTSCGVMLTLRRCRYPGCPHTFNIIFPETQVARKVDHELREGVRWLSETRARARSSSCVLN